MVYVVFVICVIYVIYVIYVICVILLWYYCGIIVACRCAYGICACGMYR